MNSPILISELQILNVTCVAVGDGMGGACDTVFSQVI